MSPTTQIQTGRLQLRRLVPTDAAALFAYRGAPEVARFQSWAPDSLAACVDWIEAMGPNTLWVAGRWCQLAIELQAPQELIGDCGIHILEGGQQAEFGITLAPAYQGQGYATEALTAIFSQLFEVLGLHRISASVDPRNLASVALMERIGLRKEAHHIKSYWFRGDWADDVIFAMLREEWLLRYEREDHP